jgi:hypothetical protein
VSDFQCACRCAVVAAVLSFLTGCAPQSPEERAASAKAWAARDAERAAECSQRGGRYIGSSCQEGGRN